MATEDEAKSVDFVIMLENEVVKHLLLWYDLYCMVRCKDGNGMCHLYDVFSSGRLASVNIN